MIRYDDPVTARRYFRSDDRVFQMNSQWYFAAREGDQGPFRSHDAANREVVTYAAAMRDLRDFQQSRTSRRMRQDAVRKATAGGAMAPARSVLADAALDQLKVLA